MNEQLFLRECWLKTVPERFRPKPPEKLPSLEKLRKSEWSPRFEKAMRDRLIFGAFRYGLIENQDYSEYDLVQEARKRLERFESTKNLEMLVDAANMLLLRFVHGERVGEVLTSIDDGEHSEKLPVDWESSVKVECIDVAGENDDYCGNWDNDTEVCTEKECPLC